MQGEMDRGAKKYAQLWDIQLKRYLFDMILRIP